MSAGEFGFTLNELLIVFSILGAMAAVMLPQLHESVDTANVEFDRRQLHKHHLLLELVPRSPSVACWRTIAG